MPYKKLSPFLLTDEESVENIPDIKNLEASGSSERPVRLSGSKRSSESSGAIVLDVVNAASQRKRRCTGSSDASSVNMDSPATTMSDLSFEFVSESECVGNIDKE